MSNDTLMLLFQAVLFLLVLLTFKGASSHKVEDVSSTKQIKICSFTHVTYLYNVKKIVAPGRIGKLLFLLLKVLVIPVA